MGTGFGDLDDMTGGLRPGGIWLVCGSPGVGRTALLTQLAVHVGLQDLSCVLLTARESASEVFAQMTRQLSPRPRRDGWLGLSAPEYKAAQAGAAERLATTGLWLSRAHEWVRTPSLDALGDLDPLDLAPYLTYEDDLHALDKQRGLLDRIGEERPADVLLVDDLDRALATGDNDEPLNLRAELERLHLWAERQKFVVVVSIPESLVLRHGQADGVMRRTAQVVLRVTRPGHLLIGEEAASEPRCGEADFELLSNRKGPTGVVTVAWQPARRRFTDMGLP